MYYAFLALPQQDAKREDEKTTIIHPIRLFDTTLIALKLNTNHNHTLYCSLRHSCIYILINYKTIILVDPNRYWKIFSQICLLLFLFFHSQEYERSMVISTMRLRMLYMLSLDLLFVYMCAWYVCISHALASKRMRCAIDCLQIFPLYFIIQLNKLIAR